MTETIAALFERAVSRHRAHDLAAAERLYRQVLAIDPGHADSLHLLGLAAGQAGRHDEAASLIARAIALEPNVALFHFNLGNALRRLGRGEDAIAAYRRAVGLQPDYAAAWVNMGVALRDGGRTAEAAGAYGRAIAFSPGHAQAHYNHGVALEALGRDEEAVGAFRRAVALQPDLADGHANLGAALAKLGRMAEAVAAWRRSLDLRPDDADTLTQLASALHELGESEPAADAYGRAAALRPRDADGLVNLAIALQEVGRAGEAADAIDQAIAVDGTHTTAWRVRSDLKTFTPGDHDLPRMQALLAVRDRRPINLDDRLNLEFALGKAWMDIGDPDRAFSHLDEGNRRLRATLVYDVQDDLAEFERLAQSFAAGVLDRFAGCGRPSERPVFVVGMPRSGSTLVEQILASHPDVHGGGELTALEDTITRLLGPFPNAIAQAVRLGALEPSEVTALAEGYLATTNAIGPGKGRLIDKMPANFRFAGLVHLMLPGARIVHCRRDPADTCLSCYARRFARGQPFAYDQRELGTYYRGYERLMAHWSRALPASRLLEIRYEDVVADLEGQARRLVDFLGLEWDDACLAFHQTRRQVRTSSVNQVRRPLYATSVGRWKPYRVHLGPLLDALARRST